MTIRYGSCRVVFPERWDGTRRQHVRQELWLLVVKGYGDKGKRVFFYSNIPLTNDLILRQTVRRYSDRWAVEEELEFLKRRLHLEDVRVRHWKAIERVCLSVMLAFAFALNLWLKTG